MSNLLAKRYKNNQVKTETNAKNGKKLAGKQKVADKHEAKKDVKTENVSVMKEPKTLMLD